LLVPIRCRLIAGYTSKKGAMDRNVVTKARAVRWVTPERYAELVAAPLEQVEGWMRDRAITVSRGKVAAPAHRSPPPGYLRVRDFAAQYRVTTSWVYHLVKTKKVASCRVPTRGGYYRTFIPPWEILTVASDERSEA
jgi:hypothetical protein